MTKRDSAVAATAFSAPAHRLIIPTIAVAILDIGWAGFLPCHLPFLAVSTRMVRSEGPDEPRTHAVAKRVVLHLFYGGLLLGAAWVALLPFPL